MNTIFIIGGIGSGKSTVARYFNERGVATLDLDKVGHEALTLEEVKTSLSQAFGREIIDSDGRIDRKILATKAFETPDKTKLLTDITAPHIISLMKLWAKRQLLNEHPFVIVEVSAFDGPYGNYGQLASSIIAVVAPVKTRIARAMKNGFTQDDVKQRISQQATDDQRRLWARYVLENDGTPEELKHKLDLLWEELHEAAC